MSLFFFFTLPPSLAYLFSIALKESATATYKHCVSWEQRPTTEEQQTNNKNKQTIRTNKQTDRNECSHCLCCHWVCIRKAGQRASTYHHDHLLLRLHLYVTYLLCVDLGVCGDWCFLLTCFHWSCTIHGPKTSPNEKKLMNTSIHRHVWLPIWMNDKIHSLFDEQITWINSGQKGSKCTAPVPTLLHVARFCVASSLFILLVRPLLFCYLRVTSRLVHLHVCLSAERECRPVGERVCDGGNVVVHTAWKDTNWGQQQKRKHAWWYA